MRLELVASKPILEKNGELKRGLRMKQKNSFSTSVSRGAGTLV